MFSPSICVFVPCNLREQSLYENLLPRGARNQPDEGEAWSAERCWRDKHTLAMRNAWSQTGASLHTLHTNSQIQVYTHMHTLQGLREGELERVGCYLFISFSCSQEATSPQSCKHTETRASVSLNPGNNKRSLYTSMHTFTWDACTSTSTNLGCQSPGRAKTRQHPSLRLHKDKTAEHNAGQALSNRKGKCKRPVRVK